LREMERFAQDVLPKLDNSGVKRQALPVSASSGAELTKEV